MIFCNCCKWGKRSLSTVVAPIPAAPIPATTIPSTSPNMNPNQSFNPDKFREFEIKSITQLSPNVKKYEIFLDSPEHVSGFTTTSHIWIKGRDGSKPYTPTSLNHVKGIVEVVIKSYPGGNVSGHLDSLSVGSKVSIRGPFQSFKYNPNMKKCIGMIAGGTGITPMFQVIQEILYNNEDNTEIFMLYANRNIEDILLKDKLDELAHLHPRFKINYILSNPPSLDWNGGMHGHVKPSMIQQHLPPPSPDSMILVCGPQGMMESVSGLKAKDKTQGVLSGMLKELGYEGIGRLFIRIVVFAVFYYFFLFYEVFNRFVSTFIQKAWCGSFDKDVCNS